MLKRLWTLTTIILLTTTLGSHGLVAFTQHLPPYYNCIHLRDVQVSLNRHLNYLDSPAFITISESPNHQWRIRQEFDETVSLENIDNGRKIPIAYNLDTSSHIYWSPDSTVFAVAPYHLPSDVQQPNYSFNVLFVSINGDSWQVLFPGHQVFHGLWSPDSHRIILQEPRTDLNRHLWAYELSNGRRWDMGYFSETQVYSTPIFDQCADLITILRHT